MIIETETRIVDLALLFYIFICAIGLTPVIFSLQYDTSANGNICNDKKKTHSLILLAKLVDVFVSYHAMSCLRTALRNILRILEICLEAAILSTSTMSIQRTNIIADSAAQAAPKAAESS